MKGILLAGGTGSRLFPATRAVCKQLLPVYDKPMVYHPLTTLMLSGIRQIAVVTTPHDAPAFRALLGDGSAFGLDLHWLVQPSPDGIAQALVLAGPWLDGACSALSLGDNLLFGTGLTAVLREAATLRDGAHIFATRVADPSRYGVLAWEGDRPVDLVEKPARPPSRWAVPGLYFHGPDAPARAAALAPSGRGELEITDLNRGYLAEGRLRASRLGRGVAWLDMGTPDSLHAAAAYVAAIQGRQGVLVGSPEEVAWRQGWIDDARLAHAVDAHAGTAYGDRLRDLLDDGGA